MSNSPSTDDWHQRLEHSCSRAQTLTNGLTPEQLNWKLAPDKWSIAQCLEHILLAADSYYKNMLPAIAHARKKQHTAADNVPLRHTLFGRMILWAVEPTAKHALPAPKMFKPTQSSINSDIVQRFIQSHEQIIELLRQCDGLDLNRIKLASPESRFIRVNAADTFEILAAHAERHLNQADRVKLSPGFPA